MAYNSKNHHKAVDMIVRLYLSVKEYDIADTFIVRHVFPKHNIYISYRTWVNYKSGYIARQAAMAEQTCFKPRCKTI